MPVQKSTALWRVRIVLMRFKSSPRTHERHCRNAVAVRLFTEVVALDRFGWLCIEFPVLLDGVNAISYLREY